MDTTNKRKEEDMDFNFYNEFLSDVDTDFDGMENDNDELDRIIGIRITKTSKDLSERIEDYSQRQTFTTNEGDYITFMIQSVMEVETIMELWKQKHEISVEVGDQKVVLNGRFTCKPLVTGCYLITGRIRWTDLAGLCMQNVSFHMYIGNVYLYFTNGKAYNILPGSVAAKIEPLELYLTTRDGNIESCTRHGFGPDERDYARAWFTCKNNFHEQILDDKLVEVEFLIWDDNDVLKKQFTTLAHVEDNRKEVGANIFFNMIGWEDGFYRVEVRVWGQTICHAIYVVGQRLNGKSMIIVTGRKKKENQRSPDIKAIKRIHEMVGLEEVKKHLEQNICYVRMMEARKQAGLPCVNRLMHVVMTGSPGTGKTTVARLLGAAYKEMNILSSGHTVECNRATLVQDHIGGTEKATLEKIEEAKGGVLFIDEAYSLLGRRESSNDFGMRIIDTLMTVLSDPDSDILVVLAGYADEMDKLLMSNPGLASRFPVRLHFPDYSVDELMLMIESWFKEHHYKANAKVMQRIREVIVHASKEKSFGAGRFVHTFIENTILPNMATRLFARVPLDEYNAKALTRILPQDIPVADEILARIKGPEKKVRAIGFR